MKSFKLNIYIIEILLILIVGLIPLLWFKPGYMALGHDMGFPLAPADYFIDRLFTWTDRVGSFGSNQTDSISGIFIHGLEALLSFLGLSLVQTQQLTFIFWFILPGITMYILLRSLHPNKEDSIIRISGTLFYMLNHYLLQAWLIAERTKFSIVAALPIVILTIINVIYRRKSIVKNSVILTITLFFLNGGAGIPLWGGLLVAALTCLVIVFSFADYPIRERLKRTLSFVGLSTFFIFMLNMYWVYPYIQSFTQNYTQRVEGSGGQEGAVSWSGEISRNASFTNLLKLQGIPDWYDNKTHPYANDFLNNYFLVLLSLIFPIIGFIGLMTRNESRNKVVYKICFLGLLIISIPFTAGSHPPTGEVYDFLLRNLPGFSIFRTPFYKFGMILWFAYAYLIAIGLKNIVELIYPKVSSKLSFKFTNIILLVIYIIILGIYNYPFFTGNFFNWSKNYSTMVKVPDYVFESKKELDGNKFSSRTLLIPNLNPATKYVIYDWKYLSLSTIPSMLSRRPVVINDATLQGNEVTLVDIIYSQLTKNGNSNLLGYLGVNKAIIMDDLNEPENPDYNSSKLKSLIQNNQQFIHDKTIGAWEFLNINDSNYKPLFYAPRALTYIQSDPSHLKDVVDIPQLQLSKDALLFSNIWFPTDIPHTVMDNFVSQSIIEGICLTCSVKEDFLEANPPRILPGDRLYFLVRFIENRKLNNIKNFSEKIDFVIGTLAKNSAALKMLIANSRNRDTVINIVDDWNEKLDELKIYYLSISDPNVKLENSYKIYRYLWFLIVGSQDWKMLSDNSGVVNKLSEFENRARKLLVDLKLEPATLKENDDITRYQIDIPKEGDYKISVYSHTTFDVGTEKQQNTAVFDNQSIDLPLVKDTNNWYQSKLLHLSSKEYKLSFRSDENKKTNIPEFIVEAKEARTQCQDIDLGSVDPANMYQVEFDNENIAGNSLRVDLYERTESFSKGKLKDIGKLSEILSTKPTVYRTRFAFRPDQSIKFAYLKFCLDGNYTSPSTSKVWNIELNEIYSPAIVLVSSLDQPLTHQIPNIQFVTLNQTKYLVKVEGQPAEFILNFNSRFDKEWKLREVDSNLAEKYFSGEKKQYLNGKVIEYQKRDQHILTDYIFPSKQQKQASDIFLNTFSNAWIIKDDTAKGDTKVYLVEYDYQNTLYKTIAISLISFLLIIIVYCLAKKYEKNT